MERTKKTYLEYSAQVEDAWNRKKVTDLRRERTVGRRTDGGVNVLALA